MFMIFFNCLIPKRNLSIVNFLEQQLWLEIFCLVLKMGGGSKKHPVYLPPFSSFPSQLSTSLKSILFYIYPRFQRVYLLVQVCNVDDKLPVLPVHHAASCRDEQRPRGLEELKRISPLLRLRFSQRSRLWIRRSQGDFGRRTLLRKMLLFYTRVSTKKSNSQR